MILQNIIKFDLISFNIMNIDSEIHHARVTHEP